MKKNIKNDILKQMLPDDDLKYYTRQLARYERKLSSLSWNFWRGVVYGLGFFIGSAILAALLIYILSGIEGWGNIGKFVHDIIQILKNNQS